MASKRRIFTDEFRKDAASLVLIHNYSVSRACNLIGIVPSVMRRWMKKYDEELSLKLCAPTNSVSCVESDNVLEDENSDMEKEIKMLRMIIYTLMKHSID